MNGPSGAVGYISHRERQNSTFRGKDCWLLAGSCALVVCLGSGMASAQAITIDKQGNATNGSTATVDRRYSQIKPTNVPLTESELDAKARQELIRVLEAEQGFAMRPFPRGHKGLTLVANGKLNPAGEDYLSMVTAQGLCAKPGDRLVLSDVKIEHNKIIFDLNGGPDLKHRFLRHIQLGAGNATAPVAQGNDQEATGARLTLEFKGHIPEVTGAQVKLLLAPLISFDVKTPIEAFTDTLPPKLKEAILTHHVMVGMSTDMVLFAKGPPQTKTREMEGQMPFEEWIYGRPPKDIEFVRINGNRVIRVEVAKMGEKPIIYTQDEVEGLMRTDGTPLVTADESKTRTVKLGDVQKDPDKQAPSAAPSLRKPGETVPDSPTMNKAGEMRPVQFPKQKPDDYPNARPNEGSSTSTSAPTTAPDQAPPATAPQTGGAPSADPNASQSAPAQPPTSQPH
jgi:hypothetical protein